MAAKKPRIIVHQGQGSIFFAWGICQFPREQLQLSSRTDAGTVLLPIRRTQKRDWLPSNASAALVSEIHAWVARVLRGNHPCRGGGREGFEMNPRTGRELSVSPRQLLSLRGEDPVSAPFCKSFSSPLHNVQRKALAVRPVSMAVHWVSRGTLGIP